MYYLEIIGWVCIGFALGGLSMLLYTFISPVDF